jgi:methylglutaconyl-CoA hydratase
VKEESELNKIIIVEKLEDIAVVSLNRPEKRNALNPAMLTELSAVMNELSQDQRIRGIILTGSGSAFCAGADLSYLKEISRFGEKENLMDSRRLADIFYKMYSLPKITVAMVNGPALAGGCGLALCCDYIFADQGNAWFGFTETRIGFIPAIVMNFLIRRVSPSVAFRLAIGAQIFDAEMAQKTGLVDLIVSAEDLRNKTLAFMGDLLQRNSFEAMLQTKKLFQQLLDLPLKEGLEVASRENAHSRQSSDCQKGLKHFLNKTTINWRSES